MMPPPWIMPAFWRVLGQAPNPVEGFTLAGATGLLGLFSLLAWRAWIANRDTTTEYREATAEQIGRLDADRKWWRDEAYARGDALKAEHEAWKIEHARVLELEQQIRDLDNYHHADALGAEHDRVLELEQAMRDAGIPVPRRADQ